MFECEARVKYFVIFDIHGRDANNIIQRAVMRGSDAVILDVLE